MPPSTNDYVMDFRKEEKPEGGVRVKPQTVLCKIGRTKVIRSSQKGTIGLLVPCIIMEGKDKKKKVTEKLWKSPKAFHRFRELLEAAGKKVPSGDVDIRRIGKAVEGEEVYVCFVDDKDDTGQYATKSVVNFQGGFISPDDYEDTEDDEEDDDLDSDEEDDEEDDDLDEDTEDDDEEDEDEPPARNRRRKNGAAKASSKRKKTRRSSSDDDEDDDELGLSEFE